MMEEMKKEVPATKAKSKNFLLIFRRGPHDFYDYGLVFVTLFLVCFGLVMIYSTTAYSDAISQGSQYYSLKKQGVFALIAIALMFIISKVDYHVILKLAPAIFLGAFMMTIVVLFIGKNENGSTRWLRIAGISIQPSELVKPALIMMLSWYLSKFYIPRPKNAGQELLYSFIGLIFTVAAAGPVLKENLSTAIIIALIGYIMCYITFKIDGVYIGFAIAGVVFIVYMVLSGKIETLSFLKTYQRDRITAWLHPTESSVDSAYQILQGLYAIGSGGIFGKGLGNSIQKLGFLPEAQNDMIFTIICEELGICGAILVMVLYVILIIRLMFIANNAPDMSGSLLVIGIMVHISVQVLFNIAVVTNFFPNTGVILPFISLGGSALMVLICEIGLALSVSNQIKVDGK